MHNALPVHPGFQNNVQRSRPLSLRQCHRSMCLHAVSKLFLFVALLHEWHHNPRAITFAGREYQLKFPDVQLHNLLPNEHRSISNNTDIITFSNMSRFADFNFIIFVGHWAAYTSYRALCSKYITGLGSFIAAINNPFASIGVDG